MNGIPVSPGRKMENAPTWRPPKPLFGTHFRPLFWPNFPDPNPKSWPYLFPTLFSPRITNTILYFYIYRLLIL